MPESETVWVTFDDELYLPAYMDTTYHVDGNTFLNELFEGLRLFENVDQNASRIAAFATKAKLMLDYFGVSSDSLGRLTRTRADVRSLREVAQLPSEVVFNCMGFFSKAVFEDDNLVSVKGSMIYFHNSRNVTDFYNVRMGVDDELLILPSSDYVAVGVSKSPNPIDIREDRVVMSKLYDKATRFFKPKL